MDTVTIQHTAQFQQIVSFIFMFIGLTSALLAIFFWGIIKYSFFRGFAFPFFCVGLIEMFYFSYNNNVIKTSLNNTPFLVSVILTALLALGGFVFFKNKFWKGLFLGLAIKFSILALLKLILF